MHHRKHEKEFCIMYIQYFRFKYQKIVRKFHVRQFEIYFQNHLDCVIVHTISPNPEYTQLKISGCLKIYLALKIRTKLMNINF